MGYTDRSSAESSDQERSIPLYHDSQPPAPGMLGGVRHVAHKVTRRHVLVLLFIVSLFFIGNHRQTIQAAWKPIHPYSGPCTSTRDHAHTISPPEEPHAETLTALWGQLWLTFTSHGTVPAHLQKAGGHKDDDDVAMVREQVVLTNEEAAATRASHEAMVKDIPPYPVGLYKGAGIVTLAGGPFSEYAATSLGMLREFGSRLPAEIWVINEQEEMEGWCDELRTEGIACRRLSDYVDTNVLTHPYQYKVLTMLLSSFEEVIFLDADSMPLINVDELFQSEQYLTKGAILWPDYWKSTASAWTAYIMGLAEQKGHMFENEQTIESGQMIWNKQKHWRSLVLAAYYNFLGPDYYYTLLSGNYAGWGDKDTFPWALRSLGEEWHMVPHEIVTVFQVPTEKKPESNGIGMAQCDPRNATSRNPVFLHNNMIKWSMRTFLCEDCPVLWVDAAKPSADTKKTLDSHWQNKDSALYEHLHQNLRIIRSETMARIGLDPEPVVWKAFEHTACRSKAWGSAQMCKVAREHMRKTFGFEFRPATFGGSMEFGSDVCMIDPPGAEAPATPTEAPVHAKGPWDRRGR